MATPDVVKKVLTNLNIDYALKDKQLEIIKLIIDEKKNVIAVLPTGHGYGKSDTFGLTPLILDEVFMIK